MENKRYVVYKHTNKLNNKAYIGITSQKPPEKRWGVEGIGYASSPHFYSAIRKYGWDNFDHEILFENLPKNEAGKKEQELIAQYNTSNRKFGYNSTSGGEIFTMNKETKIKISKALMGNKNGLGHFCSTEKKEKIRQSQKGKPFTEEHKRKLSEAAKKRRVPCSQEKKKILQEAYPHKRKIYCEELDTVFPSVQECARQIGANATNISKVCRGRGKTVKGYHLRYYKDHDK